MTEVVETDAVDPSDASNRARTLYLDLMKKSLTGMIYGDESAFPGQRFPYNERIRSEGRDWPSQAHTMIGMKRLNNIQFCVEDVLQREVRGDLIETGVWRGGAVIFMRAILKAYGVEDRHVWAADSFEGVPAPDPINYPLDADLTLNEYEELAVSVDQVRSNFRRYDLLDGQVHFLKGWFSETLPCAPISHLSILRLDGDLYQSTMEALRHLYPKLQLGGYAIIDDFNWISACREAVLDYRREFGIVEEMIPVDTSAVFWRKESSPSRLAKQNA